MKKIYASLAVVVFFSMQAVVFAQAKKSNLPVTNGTKSVHSISTLPGAVYRPLNPDQRSKDRCGFVTQMNNAVAAGYDRNAFEAVVSQKIEEIRANRAAGRGATAINYVIPVVFHVIHDGTAEGVGANVSAAQIYQQIDQLNKDFGNQSGSPFAAAANTGLTFCPVLVNPSGTTLAQPGIDRINRITKGWNNPVSYGTSNAQTNALINYVDGTIKPASIWDPTKYVNIWMYDFSASALLGYATFPTAGLSDLPAGETATTAGAVFRSGAVGSLTSPGAEGNVYGLGRTITHELGHFFGLYHIWGDEDDCSGSDLCDDTPPCSSDYYSQVPACTIPVQCSGQPRMIQNYMDYSDDGCMNTYTLNQTDRIQAVMAVAPRRPKNPAATLCTPPVANALSFTSNSATVAETGTGTGCPKFKEYTVTVKPAVAASGNATVNFTVTGSATLTSDYTIIGSTTVGYTNGETTAKGFTIRVIDDGATEATETIIVNYTIVGTGLVAGSSNQSNTITITDDDAARVINNNGTVTLFSENFGTTASSGALPTGWFNGVIESGSVNTFTANANYGVSTGFTNAANGRVLHVTNGTTAQQTAETAAAAYTPGTATTPTVISDAIAITKAINTSGYGNIKLSFDYACNGEADADGIYDLGLLTYSVGTQTSGISNVTDAGGDPVYFQGKTAKTAVTVDLPAAVANQSSVFLGFEWYNDEYIGNNPGFIIDNIVVTGSGTAVETAATQSATITQNSGQSAQYISGNGNIIAAVANLNQNVGCITASVNQAGSATLVNLSTSGGTYQRSSKVIWIRPAAANTTATYQATFYYTTAELSNWSNPLLLKIMKVNDGVDVFGTVSGSNAVLYTPTVDDQRATKGYVAYTINATGGFSQFLLVSQLTVLPVQDLKFAAKANSKNIGLTWSTTSEVNNKGFAIERSTDGTTFEKIGWVDGVVNSDRTTNYAYADNFVQPDVLYYYRLRQTDLDGRFVISDIRSARIKGSGISISISPNPATDVIKVFVAGSNGTSDVKLFNAEGQLIRSWNRQNLSAPTTLDVSGLAKGMYLISIITDGKTKVEKLIIK